MSEKKQNVSGIFRKKSIDRVTGPEQLNDYIKVTPPSVWLVLAALIILLAGGIIWGIFGTVEVQSEDGSVKTVHPIVYITN